jgi:NADH dehydrogenase/NADH:ubiquinone oxidoreductase subunit G
MFKKEPAPLMKQDKPTSPCHCVKFHTPQAEVFETIEVQGETIHLCPTAAITLRAVLAGALIKAKPFVQVLAERASSGEFEVTEVPTFEVIT